MPASVPRNFTLVDAMILIAAAGVSLVLMRDYVGHPITQYVLSETLNRGLASGDSLWRLGTLGSGIMAPLATALCLALWTLRLRKPRPPIHDVFRQPGMVACSAAVFETSLFVIKALLSEHYYYRTQSMMPDLHRLWMIRLPWNGEVVAVAWLLLWLSGVWQSEPSWIDRAGRGVGAYWIVSGVFFDYVSRF